jgi:hypothetical protein
MRMMHALRITQHYKMECWDHFHDDGTRCLVPRKCSRRHLRVLNWIEEIWNTNPYAGRNKYLDATLKTGLASPAWYVFLVGAAETTAAITSGQVQLTITPSDFTSADAGSAIIVAGAGASGADLATTIATYTNGTTVQLSASAGTTVSGARCAWGPRVGDTFASHAPWPEVQPYSNGTRPQWTPGTISNGSVDNSGSPAVFNINATNFIFGAGLCDNSNKGQTTGTLLGMGINATTSQPVVTGNTLNVTVTCSIT